MILKLTVLFLFITLSVCEMCEEKYAIDISNGTYLNNGDIIYNNITFHRYEYFKKGNQLRGCIYNKKKWLMKCCPLGFGYHAEKKMCWKTSELFGIFVEAPAVANNSEYDDYEQLQDVELLQQFDFNFSKPICVDNEVRAAAKKIYNDFYVKKDGNLYVKTPNTIPPFLLYGPDKYCVDTFITNDENGVETTSFDALICFIEDEETDQNLFSTICMLISCVFILATVAVYGWLPELRNLHGRVLMAYLLCLFVGFAFLAAMQILLAVNNISNNCCVGFTIIIYFALESAFFWLNIMCFDIWWTFSGKRGTNLEKLSVRGKFFAYSIYAFGIPTALTVIMTALEFSGLPPHLLLPMIRRQGCFLFGYSKLLYLYGPIVILWFANLIFFILTAVKIGQIKKQTSVLKSRESATHNQQNSEKQRLFLYVKLFIVMGINWLLEVTSALYPEADQIWRFTDAYNVLIGLIVFIIFVCKRKIFRLMKKRIKDGIQNRNGAIGSITHLPRIQTNLQEYKQRDSLETIRTYCPDSDSNKEINTTSL